MELIGIDKNGFRYFMAPDNYVYQKYPNFDYFVNGINKKDQLNGWFCSAPSWERTLHHILD